MSRQFLLLLVLAAACTAAPACAGTIPPSDCTPGRSDNTCAGAVDEGPAPSPVGGPPASTYDLAGIAPSNYWYFGYDFQVPDERQLPLPLFVNRSGKAVVLTFKFDIPTGRCANDCLPGVEFHKGRGRIFKIDPALAVAGNQVSAELRVEAGESYSWIIGLWRATHPTLTVTDPGGGEVALPSVGLSPSPDIADPIDGTTRVCDCPDGAQAECNPGDHRSNGLLGIWSKNIGVSRANAWTRCQNAGT